MEQIAVMLSAEQIKVKIAQTFSLKDITKAHQLMEAGHVAGKLVLTTV